MYFFNKSKPIYFVCAVIFIILNVANAEEPIIAHRDKWTYNENNTTYTAVPSDLHYYKFYDILPDEITIPLTMQRDLTSLTGKRIVVGYGVVDPLGKDCRIFPSSVTGLPHDTKICLPWWRIEREYERKAVSVNNKQNLLCQLPKPKPPIMVKVCKEWASPQGIHIDGGRTTCTSYYDRLLNNDCWNHPQQPKCFVDNCSNYVRENCDLNNTVMGDKTTLKGHFIANDGYYNKDDKVALVTYQFNCPSGIFAQHTDCKEEQNALMYPYTCKEPTDDEYDNGEYIYCDEDKAQYDAGGKIIGFLGTCSDGREVMCEVNNFSQTSKICLEPIMNDVNETNFIEESKDRTCVQHNIDVISGETDAYAQNENCLRSNSVAEARHTVVAKINASGVIDDDIYVLKHRVDGSQYKVYCNMQHGRADANQPTVLKNCLEDKGFSSGNLTDSNITCTLSCMNDANNLDPTVDNVGDCITSNCSIPLDHEEKSKYFDCRSEILGGSSPKIYNGSTLLCLRNNGNYSFSDEIDIESGDIVSIQQATEDEVRTQEPLYARTHYGSTPVYVDGILAIPSILHSDLPYYPTFEGNWLNLWDNGLASLTIMFPYAGAYKLYFYDKNNNELVTKTLRNSDFKTFLGMYKSLELIKNIPLAPGMQENDPMNCLEDTFAEPGGGVHGGKGSKTGDLCHEPDDAYSKSHAVYKIIVKDLLTGDATVIPLTYPIVYLNNIFVSKLNIYEKRKYCCYGNF